MALDAFQALQAAQRPLARPTGSTGGTLLIAGATGALGHEVLRRLAGQPRYARTMVLTREPMRDALAGVHSLLVGDDAIARWPAAAADTALVLFDPPRLYYQRERALWAPQPGQLPALARWLHGCGVRTLALVQPHDQGRLPEALKSGLASLDEQVLAALGFERLLLLRSAQRPRSVRAPGAPERLAAWMLSIARFMVPDSERPVRAGSMARLLEAALAQAPPGIHVASPELVWRAAQGTPGHLQAVVEGWLRRTA